MGAVLMWSHCHNVFEFVSLTRKFLKLKANLLGENDVSLSLGRIYFFLLQGWYDMPEILCLLKCS